jgi:hypothetical protein
LQERQQTSYSGYQTALFSPQLSIALAASQRPRVDVLDRRHLGRRRCDDLDFLDAQQTGLADVEERPAGDGGDGGRSQAVFDADEDGRGQAEGQDLRGAYVSARLGVLNPATADARYRGRG